MPRDSRLDRVVVGVEHLGKAGEVLGQQEPGHAVFVGHPILRILHQQLLEDVRRSDEVLFEPDRPEVLNFLHLREVRIVPQLREVLCGLVPPKRDLAQGAEIDAGGRDVALDQVDPGQTLEQEGLLPKHAERVAQGALGLVHQTELGTGVGLLPQGLFPGQEQGLGVLVIGEHLVPEPVGVVESAIHGVTDQIMRGSSAGPCPEPWTTGPAWSSNPPRRGP